jgi:hypothetical protein
VTRLVEKSADSEFGGGGRGGKRVEEENMKEEVEVWERRKRRARARDDEGYGRHKYVAATTALGHGRWNSQDGTVLVLGGIAPSGSRYCSGHPPCTRRQGTWGWLEHPTFFFFSHLPIHPRFFTASMEYSRYLGPGRGFLGYEYFSYVHFLPFFFFLPRSEWGRNSATDGPTKSLAEWGSQCSGARSTHACVGGWDGTLAVISTPDGLCVAPVDNYGQCC